MEGMMKTLYTPEKLARDAEMIAVFRQKQALPYEQKVLHAAKRAREFYNDVACGCLDFQFGFLFHAVCFFV